MAIRQVSKSLVIGDRSRNPKVWQDGEPEYARNLDKIGTASHNEVIKKINQINLF